MICKEVGKEDRQGRNREMKIINGLNILFSLNLFFYLWSSIHFSSTLNLVSLSHNQ